MQAARRLYGGGQQEGANMLAAWGMSADMAAHFAASAEDAVWPENWRPVEVFAAMTTQWRHGFNGPTGLDYAALPPVMDYAGVPVTDRADVFESVRVLEIEALEAMRRGR